jgi:hypothetical protein
MKKLLLAFVLVSAVLTSCNKEKLCKSSTCGTIVNDEITFDAAGNACYSLSIKNKCSDNVKTFCFDYSTWFDGNIGEEFCVEGTTPW